MIEFKKNYQIKTEKDEAETQKLLKRFKSIFDDKEEWPLRILFY
jgi:hypothetical protein